MISKTISALIFFLAAVICRGLAQDVTVHQQGSGNSVTISQSSVSSNEKQPCDSSQINASANSGNNTLVFKSDNPDTLRALAGRHQNEFNGILSGAALSALQLGHSNIAYIMLPDSVRDNKVVVLQYGRRNHIDAAMKGKGRNNKVSYTQQGSGNRISVNPCEK